MNRSGTDMLRRAAMLGLLMLVPCPVAYAEEKTPPKGRARHIEVLFDHGKGQWKCSNDYSHGCAIQVAEGDTVTVTVVNTLPGLFSIEITQDLKEAVGISQSVAGALGIPSGGGARGGGGEDEPPPTPADAYNGLLTALGRFQSGLFSEGFSGYETGLEGLRAARMGLLAVLVGKGMPPDQLSAGDVLAKLNSEHVVLGLTEDEFASLWTELVNLLSVAPPRTTGGPSATFVYEDRDFDVSIVIKPQSTLMKNPRVSAKVVVQMENTWKISVTTGFAISGLADRHYTTKTVAGGSGTVNQAIQEDRDLPSIPEATFFVHLYPPSAHWAFSAGIGIAAEASGRTYLGLSRRMGRAGALTFGVAGGTVKRLSKGVPVDDLGEVDPEATRRDVYRGSLMVGYSWTLSGK